METKKDSNRLIDKLVKNPGLNLASDVTLGYTSTGEVSADGKPTVSRIPQFAEIQCLTAGVAISAAVAFFGHSPRIAASLALGAAGLCSLTDSYATYKEKRSKGFSVMRSATIAANKGLRGLGEGYLSYGLLSGHLIH